jgi:hypothetical protein
VGQGAEAAEEGEVMTKDKMEAAVGECEWLDWKSCYDESWRDLIVPDAFAHP